MSKISDKINTNHNIPQWNNENSMNYHWDIMKNHFDNIWDYTYMLPNITTNSINVTSDDNMTTIETNPFVWFDTNASLSSSSSSSSSLSTTTTFQAWNNQQISMSQRLKSTPSSIQQTVWLDNLYEINQHSGMDDTLFDDDYYNRNYPSTLINEVNDSFINYEQLDNTTNKTTDMISDINTFISSNMKTTSRQHQDHHHHHHHHLLY
ncbi:hypothetical protein EWB00_005508 [Schistosoma japonicum]|uniref:Uncharacterized protein n=1 Tax=Schistosoma japonicum TaxID=6182 RepID=A0A4Z2D1D8_SCHJA|nr:hypothetical protein EWB00_005508 [Schistosoma japonicum]